LTGAFFCLENRLADPNWPPIVRFPLISGVAAGFLSMSDPQTPQPNPENFLQGEPSPEELEAAQAANEADALAAATAEIAELRVKNAELADQYLRAQADVQNARRRADEEITKGRKFAIEAFAESLLPVMDSLEAGLGHKDATSEQIREGAEATLRQLKGALERNKVIEIAPAAGSKFDPHQHQAISVVPVEGQEPNTIVSVLQKGYTIADRVLRPALVTVSAPT
jgi:molecular chaperone GrpE